MASTGRLSRLSLPVAVAVLAMCSLLWAVGLAGQPVLRNLAEDRRVRPGRSMCPPSRGPESTLPEDRFDLLVASCSIRSRPRCGNRHRDEYAQHDDAMAPGVAARDAGHGPGASGDRAVCGVGDEPGWLSAHPLGSRCADRARVAGDSALGGAAALCQDPTLRQARDRM